MTLLKKNNVRLLILIMLPFALLACQQNENESSDQSSVKIESVESANPAAKMIEKAKSQLAKAAEVRFEWNTTAVLIDKAEKANASGNTKLAIELAERAINESNNSLAQAKYADEHWQDHAIN